MTNTPCKFCKQQPKFKCWQHCPKTKDGKHVIDPLSAVQAEDLPFVVDVTCSKCGGGGSIKLDPDDASWG